MTPCAGIPRSSAQPVRPYRGSLDHYTHPDTVACWVLWCVSGPVASAIVAVLLVSGPGSPVGSGDKISRVPRHDPAVLAEIARATSLRRAATGPAQSASRPGSAAKRLRRSRRPRRTRPRAAAGPHVERLARPAGHERVGAGGHLCPRRTPRRDRRARRVHVGTRGARRPQVQALAHVLVRRLHARARPRSRPEAARPAGALSESRAHVCRFLLFRSELDQATRQKVEGLGVQFHSAAGNHEEGARLPVRSARSTRWPRCPVSSGSGTRPAGAEAEPPSWPTSTSRAPRARGRTGNGRESRSR